MGRACLSEEEEEEAFQGTPVYLPCPSPLVLCPWEGGNGICCRHLRQRMLASRQGNGTGSMDSLLTRTNTVNKVLPTSTWLHASQLLIHVAIEVELAPLSA